MAEKKKLIEITDQEIKKIYDAGKEATVSFIKTIVNKVNELSEIVEKQQKEIDHLKSIISKDSHNSNKPPSSDNPYKKKTKSLRKKGGKVGGQTGHKGTNLKWVIHPDKIENINATGDCKCGKHLYEGNVIGYRKAQVIDLPEKIKTEIIEYRAEIINCECGKIHITEFPSDINAKVQYGSRIKGFVSYLKCHGFMSYERITELMKDVFNQKMSQGTLVNMINECAGRLKPSIDRIKETLINESIVHFDETGLRIEAILHWLHSAGNENYTYYFPHKKRGKIAMDAMGILPYFTGIAVHDHWDSYYQFIECFHSLCNAHHLRELQFFEEQDENWAAKLKRCLLDAKNEKDKKKRFTKKRIEYYRRRMYRILNEGLKYHPEQKYKIPKRGRPKQSKAYNLLMRMKKRIDDVLRFIQKMNVPFDNNLAERDVRMVKVQQKVSGTFRSFQGAVNFCIIRSYISTARKQGLSVFKAICVEFQNQCALSFNGAE